MWLYRDFIFVKPLIMKPVFLCLLLLLIYSALLSQPTFKTKNIFIITIDGFRWQEVYTGADPALICNRKFVEDTSLMKQIYWDEDPLVRRSRLMPFFWNVIAENGQLYGNRLFENKVNVKNIYKISYPGYNEILTGRTDPRIILNLPRNNNNINILEYLNNEKEYKGKVVAFSSWNLFPYILNEERSKLAINSGYEMIAESNTDSAFQFINEVQDHVAHKTNTRYDLLTYLNAREYIDQNHPRIVFLGFGETDHFAHQGRYDMYLQDAAAIDKMISDLWYYIQTNPFYKDQTTFIITTDHGRGKSPNSWFTHLFFVGGSGQTWIAMLGPDIVPSGEMKNNQQVYQKQIAPTISLLLGQNFKTVPGSKPIVLTSMDSSKILQLASK